jgi:hypothetical protein
MANNDVGYRHPPAGAQFKKGSSGNPKGRPKGSKNLRTDLAEELQERVVVTEKGASRCISKQRALVKTMLAKALSGDARACNTTLNLTLKMNDADTRVPADVGLAIDDRAIVEEFLARQSGRVPPVKDPEEAP